MVKRAIAAMLSMVMILGVFSGLTISAQAATTENVTLFSSGNTLADGVTWTGTTQFKSDKKTPQLAYKNSAKNAVLTFTADVTGLVGITVNGATTKAESYTVTIDNETVGTASHEARTNNGKEDWADHDVVIDITTNAEGEKLVIYED